MAAKKRASLKKKAPIKVNTPALRVEEEVSQESVAPVVEEVNEGTSEQVNEKEVLDEGSSGMIQSGDDMEPEKQEDIRRPENPEGGIWEGTDSTISQPKSGSKAPAIIALVVILALLGAGGTYFYLKNQSGLGTETETEEVVSPIEDVTPTPEVEFERSEWSLEVLNGTTTSGLAAKVASELEELGYEVEKTGNSSDKVTATELYVSADMMEKQEGLLEDLKGKFGITEITGKLEDSSASARIVVGPQEEEETPEEETEE